MTGVRGAVVAVALLASAACSGGPVLEGSAYRDPKLGWSIAAPPGGEARWRRIRVEGSALALRGPEGELMSLEVHCGGVLASPEILAHGLRSGIRESEVREEREVPVDGRTAWVQVFDARLDGSSGLSSDRSSGLSSDGSSGLSRDRSSAAEPPVVRVKTVTRVDPPCVSDFVLAAKGAWPEAEAAFDAWWGSFRPGPAAGGGGR